MTVKSDFSADSEANRADEKEKNKTEAAHLPSGKADGDERSDRRTSIDDIREEPLSTEEQAELDAFANGDQERLRKKFLLRRFMRSGHNFWSAAQGDRLAWVLTISLLFLIVANIGAQYGINVWNRKIFDALEKKDSAQVLVLAAVFLPLALASVTFNTINVWARMTTQRRWRAWLSDHLLYRWLRHGRYYQLNLVSGDHQNPEGRLTDDLRVATDAPVDFAVGVLQASLSALTFIAVLWTIGGALTIPGTTCVIPGFLVIAAVTYSTLASGTMTFVGRKFVSVSEAKNHAEADYRYQLTRVRENGESIALLGGEDEERAGIDRSLGNVLHRWRELCRQYMSTTMVSQSSSIIAPVVPIILCAPKYLDGNMSLGEVMQAASAFTIVQAAFSWLVDNYPRLADWNASARRVASLMVSLDALEKAEKGEGFNRIKRGETMDAAMRLKNLSVTLDDGTAVVGDTEVVIKKGERVLVAGESGTGKSTLVRAISGLWPWGGGEVEIQRDSRLFLLPQRPYVPTGTLRRAACYPGDEHDWDDRQIGEALDKVGLGHLKGRIDENAPWDQTLSGGEKQRLTVARVLLHRPDIVVLDEATAALDPKSQDMLMKLLSEELEGLTIVSVGHRPELEQFHSRKLVLERRRGGAKLVSDIALLKEPEKPRLLRQWLGRRRQTA